MYFDPTRVVCALPDFDALFYVLSSVSDLPEMRSFFDSFVYRPSSIANLCWILSLIFEFGLVSLCALSVILSKELLFVFELVLKRCVFGLVED